MACYVFTIDTWMMSYAFHINVCNQYFLLVIRVDPLRIYLNRSFVLYIDSLLMPRPADLHSLQYAVVSLIQSPLFVNPLFLLLVALAV